MATHESGLEVVEASNYAGLQYVPQKWKRESSHAPMALGDGSGLEHYDPRTMDPRQRRICGLKPKIFYIVVAILVTIAVAIGAGVGGGLAARHSADPTPLPSTQSPTSTTSISTAGTATDSRQTSTPTSTPNITTTEIVGPDNRKLLRDCPSSNNTIHHVTNGNTTLSFRKLCGARYPNAQPEAAVQVNAASLDECIGLCAAYDILHKEDILQGNTMRCNTVCWRNRFNDDWPGTCFGYRTSNSTTGSFVHVEASNCDSAAWINEF